MTSDLAPELQARLEKDALIKLTNDEWSQRIEKISKELKVSNDSAPVPEIGSVAFAKTVDHTLLKLDSVLAQFDELCAEAKRDQFATVCVRPPQVEQCIANLKGTDVRVACVIGFHEGNYDTGYKIRETQLAVEKGAQELDLVINYDQLKAKSYSSVYHELASIRLQAPEPILIKLIIETSQLDRDQIIAACTLAGAANLDYVKTSTGFNGPGATVENVRLMAALCESLAKDGGKRMKVKASGGVRSLADAVKMLEAGASRLGTSSGVLIAEQAKEAAEKGKGLNDVKDLGGKTGSSDY